MDEIFIYILTVGKEQEEWEGQEKVKDVWCWEADAAQWGGEVVGAMAERVTGPATLCGCSAAQEVANGRHKLAVRYTSTRLVISSFRSVFLPVQNAFLGV